MLKILIIGNGKLGFQLARHLSASGNTGKPYPYNATVELWARNPEKKAAEAQKYGINLSGDLKKSYQEAALIILAVSDASINLVAGQLAEYGETDSKMVFHCSGTTTIRAISVYFTYSAILWPIQTFSADYQAERWQNAPLVSPATNVPALKAAELVARLINGRSPFVLTDQQRQITHLGAVWANNFTNHLLAHLTEISQEVGIPLALFSPILAQTLANFSLGQSGSSQTGPASRNDLATIETHLNLLALHPESQNLYNVLTQSILKNTKNN